MKYENFDEAERLTKKINELIELVERVNSNACQIGFRDSRYDTFHYVTIGEAGVIGTLARHFKDEFMKAIGNEIESLKSELLEL